MRHAGCTLWTMPHGRSCCGATCWPCARCALQCSLSSLQSCLVQDEVLPLLAGGPVGVDLCATLGAHCGRCDMTITVAALPADHVHHAPCSAAAHCSLRSCLDQDEVLPSPAGGLGGMEPCAALGARCGRCHMTGVAAALPAGHAHDAPCSAALVHCNHVLFRMKSCLYLQVGQEGWSRALRWVHIVDDAA